MTLKGGAAAPTLANILKWNKWAALAHLLALITFAVLLTVILKPDFRATMLYRLGVAPPPPGQPLEEKVNFPQEAKTQFQLNIPWALYAFFGFTVLFHVLYATDFFGRGWYTTALERGWNPFRWLEYGISASIMIAILSSLAGNRDVNAVFTSMVVVACLQGCGFLVESQLIKSVPDGTVIRTATGLGWGLLLGVWVPIAYSLLTNIGDARSYDAKVPSWIPMIVIIQFIMYSWFGFIQLRQIRALGKGLPLPSALIVEKRYIVASFTAKLALGCFLAYGLLDRQRRSSV